MKKHVKENKAGINSGTWNTTQKNKSLPTPCKGWTVVQDEPISHDIR